MRPTSVISCHNVNNFKNKWYYVYNYIVVISLLLTDLWTLLYIIIYHKLICNYYFILAD